MAKKALTFEKGQVVHGTLLGVGSISSRDTGDTYIRVALQDETYGILLALLGTTKNFVQDLAYWQNYKGSELILIFNQMSEPDSKGATYPQFTALM